MDAYDKGKGMKCRRKDRRIELRKEGDENIKLSYQIE